MVGICKCYSVYNTRQNVHYAPLSLVYGSSEDAQCLAVGDSIIIKRAALSVYVCTSEWGTVRPLSKYPMGTGG